MNQNLRIEIDNCDDCLELKAKGLLGICQYHLDKQMQGESE